MKKIKCHLALILALLLIVSACIGNGSAVAFATESSSDMATEDVEFGSNEVTKETEAATEEKDIDTKETEVKKEISESGETDLGLESEYESAEEESILNMEAIEEVVSLFEELPAASDLENMTPEEVNEVMQRTQEAMDAFDAFSYDEGEFFINNYSELYNAVMNDLGTVLADMFNGDAQVTSLLPLEERKACLILNDKTSSELSSMKLDDVLKMLVDSEGNPITIPDNATTVWQCIKSGEDGIEEYKRYNIGQGEIINLSVDAEIHVYNMELIIGSSNQLDRGNIRYIVDVYITNTIREELGYELYLQDSNGTRKEVCPERIASAINNQIVEFTVNEYVVPEPLDGSKYYLGVNSVASKHPGVRVEVYDFWEYMASYINAEPITSTILNPDMIQVGAGFQIEYDVENMFAIAYFDKNDQIFGQSFICFKTVSDCSYIDGGLYTKDGNEFENVVLVKADHIGFLDVESLFAGDGIHELCFMMKEGCTFDSDIYCILNAHGTEYGDDANSYVVKAVEGHYDTIEAAAGSEDIKEQLIPADKTAVSRGYKADYSRENGGIPFTIFFEDGSIWKVLVIAIEYDSKHDENYVKGFTEKPIIGAADPWFRITGAKDSDGNDYDTYIIENGKNINIDTMYGYGYQTIFINQDVDSFIPTFWKANEEAISIDKIYANGSEFKEGSALSFPDGENVLDATFSVIITDKNGTHPKNYDVTFVKKASGPQLYVAGPLAPEVRSVFLDEYHENKHDIFIANIGDEPLTNLWLDLDATNVELDEYWMVGGEGNNTLSACPENFSLELDSTTYGELSNVAKIRLVPPSSGKGGAIQGTLKIYSGEEGNAANSELLATINLSDLAQNPEITTQKIDEAVKYVPYSCLITTNNMYDWVDVSYELTEGSLPDGIELIEETGELYGVPTVTGTFTFTVSTHFESTSENYAFEPSSVKLTLTVNENTDDNVFNATDIAENYSILNSIGVDNAGDHHYILEESADTVFRSEGELKQFVNLWLNGVLLEPGVDYIAESGSTKITIKAQTFDSDKTRKDGQRNTIAAEFRTTDTGSKNDKNNSNELRRTSQNFYIEKHTHSYDGGTITKAPTCIETGVRTYTCNTCGNKYTETIAALGHFSGEGKVTKKATCTDNGEKSYFCIRCNTLMRTEAIIAVGHDYSVKITQGGDCKTDGIKTYTCKNCGDSYTETIKATGHKYVAEVTIEPTETTDGLRTFTCSVCNDKFTEVIPALGDGTHLHTYDEGSVIQEATCLENGMMAYTCTQCGAIKQETILSKGHNYSEEIITEATCTESGLKKLTCVNCGDSYTAIIAAKGHSYDQGVVTKQPTNTETGIKTYTCSACGNSYTEVTPMINSTPVYGGLNNPSVETVVPNNQVACIVCLIDSNENPIGNTAVELHSAPQCFVTDSNGYVRFSAVDFGVHTLYVSNADGERISKEFHLTSGNSTSLEGDVITAEPGTAIVLTVVFDGNMLEIKGVQKSGSPETGDNSALAFWYVLMLVSLGCIVVMSYFSIKKKISNRH